MRARITTLMALAAVTVLCLAGAAQPQSDSSDKYFQSSRDRLNELSGVARNLFNDIHNPAEKFTVNYLTLVGGLRAASADLMAQLLEISARMRDPRDNAFVQAKIAAQIQALPAAIKEDIKYTTEIAANSSNKSIAKLADDLAKEFKVLLNNLEKLSYPKP